MCFLSWKVLFVQFQERKACPHFQDLNTLLPDEPHFIERTWSFEPAGELQLGDSFLSADGEWVTVESLENTGRYETVYNVRVADCHTYFVTGEGWGISVWAHNAA
jgi:hypothetical protein